MKPDDFPKLPELQAVWAPVYLEPIMHSGERITVGIAAMGPDGNARVVPAVSLRQLRCLFGKGGAEALLNLSAISLEALAEHMAKTHSFTKWKPPLSGIFMGKPRDANGASLDEVTAMAMRLSASLSSLTGPDSLRMTDRADQTSVDDDTWPSQIRQAVEQSAPQLVNNFSHAYRLIEGGRPPKFDYFGSKYVANFGKLVPRRLSDGLARARMKLWNLDIVREDSRMLNISQYELLMWKPPEGMPIFTDSDLKAISETILELEEEARKRELRTRSVSTADEASRHIISMEAA